MQSVVYNSKANASAGTTPAHNFSVAASKMLKYQHIAPAPPLQSASSDLKLMPRKYTPRSTNVPYGVDQTQSVQRRNARERNRVKQVNNSFAKLRQHIPQSIISDLTKGGGRGPHKKISKVDTLRIAVEYIRRLQDLVEDRSGTEGSGSNNSSNFLSTDTFSNISFSSSTSSSSSSEVGSSPSPPPPVATTTASTTYYTQTTSPNALPAFSQQQHFSSSLLTPVSLKSYPLDEGCASPTSSFNSSMSFDSGTFEPAPQLASHHRTDAHLDAHLQLKFEPYDAFHLQEEDCQPDDEEILDYISLWQEQ